MTSKERLATLHGIMEADKKACVVFCGNDEFQVHREGDRYVQSLQDSHADWEFEVLAGSFQNQSEVATLANRIAESLRTLPLFGGGKCLWVKAFNGLSDSPTAKSEKAQELFELLFNEIRCLDPTQQRLVMTAYPVDRRRKEYKTFVELSKLTFIESGSSGPDLVEWVGSECARLGLRLTLEGQMLLPELVRGSTRMLSAELEKLATYQGKDGPALEAAQILELVPVFGESEFFAASESFFTDPLRIVLATLETHFFSHKEARPLLTTLQGRNRLMIQLKALSEAGAIRISPRGLDRGSLEAAQSRFAPEGEFTKSSVNVFTQNPWYLGKLAQSAQSIPLKKLLAWQLEFIRAFDELIDRPQEPLVIMRELAIRCLS